MTAGADCGPSPLCPAFGEFSTGADPATARILPFMRFRTTVILAGKTATGIEVPTEIVEALGSGKRPAVSVTINGHTYRSTVAPMGGKFLLPVSAEQRGHTGVSAGEEIEVDVELDTEPRVVTVPADFAAALARGRGSQTVLRGAVLQQPASARARHRRGQSRRNPATADRQGGRDAA